MLADDFEGAEPVFFSGQGNIKIPGNQLKQTRQ
jgi:hypothetical protein